MGHALRSFLFAPSQAEHAAHRDAVTRLLPRLDDAALLEAAVRHSSSRQTAFAFAQGAVIGTMGNLFAGAVGHFIDRAGSWRGGDDAWTLLGVFALATIASTTWGALRRYRFNTQIEALYLVEVRRRGADGGQLADVDDEGEPAVS